MTNHLRRAKCKCNASYYSNGELLTSKAINGRNLADSKRWAIHKAPPKTNEIKIHDLNNLIVAHRVSGEWLPVPNRNCI